MKIKPKFTTNHKYNNGRRLSGQERAIFYTLATIMIFMNTVVDVNSVAAVATAATLTTDNKAASTTMAPTLSNNTNRNPIIAQQSSKTSPPHKPPTPMSAAPSSSSSSSSASTSTSSNNTTTSFTYQKINTDNVSSGIASNNNIQPIHPLGERLGNCKSLTGTWGDVDPNIYYLCDIQTKQPLTLRCPEGWGYFNGLGYTGCMPYENWPACVPLHTREQVHLCDSEHMQQPWETMNPNKFYICLQEAIEPMLLNCGQGKGFVHVTVASDTNTDAKIGGGGGAEVVGCANWEKWRSYMQCTDYY